MYMNSSFGADREKYIKQEEFLSTYYTPYIRPITFITEFIRFLKKKKDQFIHFQLRNRIEEAGKQHRDIENIQLKELSECIETSDYQTYVSLKIKIRIFFIHLCSLIKKYFEISIKFKMFDSSRYHFNFHTYARK